MPRYMEAGKMSELRKGQMKAVTVAGREILLANTEKGLLAAGNVCPHMGGKLNQGTLKGTIITCPRHASKFDLRDGSVVRWTNWSGIKLAVSKVFRSPRPLKTYSVTIQGDNILVKI